MSNELKSKLAEIRENFEFFDNDGNGLIDFNELLSLMRTVSPEASLRESGDGFSMIDTNSDGYIDLDEFMKWWQTTWWEF